MFRYSILFIYCLFFSPNNFSLTFCGYTKPFSAVANTTIYLTVSPFVLLSTSPSLTFQAHFHFCHLWHLYITFTLKISPFLSLLKYPFYFFLNLPISVFGVVCTFLSLSKFLHSCLFQSLSIYIFLTVSAILSYLKSLHSCVFHSPLIDTHLGLFINI